MYKLVLCVTFRNLNYIHIPHVNMSVLTQKLNPITGQSDWEMQNEYYDYHQEIARSAYADMLHDKERNQKYYEALKIAINKMKKRGQKANVLDIGTGTGLLSMMAVRCGADSVVACEGFKPMSSCAQRVIEINGFKDRIKVIPKRSTELTVGRGGDLMEPANILVTEVFDTELIGEGALGTFSHAHKYLLEKDCYVIPNSANVYAQVIESSLAVNWNKLKDIFNMDGERLLSIPKSVKNCAGASAVHDIQLSEFPPEFINTIVQPQVVQRFDFSGSTPLNFKNTNILPCKAQQDGIAQVVFMWWDIVMDPDNTIILSCAPYWAHPLTQTRSENEKINIPWRDHWMQAIYYLPQEVPVKKGEEIYLSCSHDEYSMWFNLSKNLNSAKENAQPLCDCDVHIAFSRTRIGQLNDSTRTKKYVSVLEKNITNDSIVLVLSSGFYTGMVASKLGAKKVYYVEENILLKRVIEHFARYNNLSNVYVYTSINDLRSNVDVKEINLVFGEPHFSTSIVPWDNLHFCYLFNSLKASLPNSVALIPFKAQINVMAMNFDNLYKIHAPIEVCEGFKMKPFDVLIKNSSSISDADVEAQPLWEYPGIALSNIKTIANLSLKDLFETDVLESNGIIKIESEQSCNGIAIWTDWYLDESTKNKISTGPIIPPVIGQKVVWDIHTRQGVTLFREKKDTKELKYLFKFDTRNGQIIFKINK